MRLRGFILGVVLVLLFSVNVIAAGNANFIVCNEKGESLNTAFSKATITVSGIDASGNYIYKGVDIAVFKKGQTEAVYQKRVMTNALKVQIADFGDSAKYNPSDIYVLGYRVLYTLIDNEEGSIIETEWKNIEGSFFKLNDGTVVIKEKEFKDVAKSHWAYQALLYMVNNGVISGYDDGTFKPNDKITREGYAKMLSLACNIPQTSPEKATYADVSDKDWAYSYIESVKPYLEGYKIRNKLYFKGKINITREQAISALVKAKGLSNQNVDVKELSVFKDYSAISSKYAKDILIAYKNNIISGDGQNVNPKQILTRAEAVMLLYGAVK